MMEKIQTPGSMSMREVMPIKNEAPKIQPKKILHFEITEFFQINIIKPYDLPTYHSNCAILTKN
jgi:hypothetical protein